MQGHHDFPPLWKDLVAELNHVAKKEGISICIADKAPTITRLRQPLLLALAVSPLILLLDIAPLSTNLTRLHMLRAWYHYGNQRPGILSRVERLLWNCLFGIARGTMTSSFALETFLREMAPLLSLTGPEKDFFRPSSGKAAVMPTALEYEHMTVTSDKQTRGSSEDGSEEQLRSTVIELSEVEQDSLSVIGTRDVGNMGPFPNGCEPYANPIIFQGSNSQQSRSNVPEQSLLSTTDKIVDACVATDRKGSDDLFSDLKPNSGDDVMTQEFYRGLASQGHEGFTAFQHNVTNSNDPSTSVSALICQTAVPSVSRRTSVSACSFPSEWRKPLRGDGYLVLSPTRKQRSYWPSLYDALDQDVVASLFDRCNLYQRKHGNAFLFHRLTLSPRRCASAEELLCALSGVQVKGLACVSFDPRSGSRAVDGLSELIRSDHVLVSRVQWCDSLPVGSALDEIGGCHEHHSVIDFSLATIYSSPFQGPFHASFSDFLREGCAIMGTGRIMCFPAIPDRREGHTPCPLATSAFSRVHSFPFPELSNQRASRQSLRWYFVGSANAYYFPRTAPVGFNVEITVKEGAILLFLGMLSVEDTHGRKSRILENEDVAGTLLSVGDSIILRPDTPYCVLALEPAVYRGCYFYCKSSMNQSYRSILRQFLDGEDNTLADNIASLDMLSSVAAFWHDMIVNHTARYIDSCTTGEGLMAHVPNVFTLNGLLDLFSLLAIAEFGTLLWVARYLGGGRCSSFEESYHVLRRLGFDMLDVLNKNVSIRDLVTGSDLSIWTMWSSFFVQQCVALLKACGGLCSPSVSSAELSAQLLEDLQRDKFVLYLVQSLLSGETCNFGKPGCCLSASDCTTFTWSMSRDFRERYLLRIRVGYGDDEPAGNCLGSLEDSIVVERPSKRQRRQ
ncbi:hypothetical protein VNI00_017656 [Paramarasmius palmivorus]|uniref:Uncharacterized protein n=1 Tax=Paramarasmius palmivorus TaxID=297713 RepID=A0AAW0B4U9_9AGAR